MPSTSENDNWDTSGRRDLYKVVAVAVAVVVLTSTIAIILTRDGNDGENGREVYHYGDYEKHYSEFFLGIPIGGSNCFLNEELDLTVPRTPDRLPIYQHQPPELKGREDAISYLAQFGFDVSSYSYDTFEHPDGFSFHLRRDGIYIGLVIDGRFSVSYSIPDKEGWQPNITKEEAIAIGIEYIENHTGIPEESRMVTDTHAHGSSEFNGTMVTAFSVFLRRIVDGHLTYGGGGRDSIRVRVDAQYARVESFDYHWPNLEWVEDVDPSRIGDLEEIVNAYIASHNERVSTHPTPPERTHNVTSVYIVYRNPPRASAYGDLYEGCLFYTYLPYVMVEWDDGDGLTTLSPLASAST